MLNLNTLKFIKAGKELVQQLKIGYRNLNFDAIYHQNQIPSIRK